MELTTHQIAQKIRAGLRRHRSLLRMASIKPEELKVLEDEIRWENECWYVPLQPARYPEKTSPYFEALAEIQTELLFDDDINTFIIPSSPPEAEKPRTRRASKRTVQAR